MKKLKALKVETAAERPLPVHVPPPRRVPSPPEHLSAPMRTFWREVVDGHELTPGGLELLRRLCENWDLAEEAWKVVSKEGLTTTDRWGQVKEHPALKAYRDACITFLRLHRELGLQPPPPESRAPRLY